MQNLASILALLFSLIILQGCGSSSDDSVGVVSGVPFLSVGSSLVINSDNVEAFDLQGECRGVETVKVEGNFNYSIPCENSAWKRTVDLSFLPNGVHKISVTASTEVVELEIKKDTLSGDALASYPLSDGADLGNDETDNFDAQSVTDVVASQDSERGTVAEFNGSSSVIQLSNGSFFNDSFKNRTFSFFFKSSDLTTSQVIVDEGGSGNGMGVRLENDQVILGVRAGGSSSQTEVSHSVAGLENSWIQVTASFLNGKLIIRVNDQQSETTASYNEIPRHGDTGGLGNEIGSSVFDGMTLNPFEGFLSSFKVFDKALSNDELLMIAGKDPEVRELNSLDLGRVVSMNFEDALNLGQNQQDGFPNAVVSNVTQGSDSSRGSTAVFNGTDSSFQISNGSFWNDAFDVKTYALYFKASDLVTEQVLFDEGGSTNGISLRIDNGYLYADARAGSSAPAQVLIEDIIDLNDQWVKVVIQFNKGDFSMSVNGGASLVSRSAGFTTIPDHSSDGGLGMRYGSDASGNSGDARFTGEISKFSIYVRPLSAEEIKLY